MADTSFNPSEAEIISIKITSYDGSKTEDLSTNFYYEFGVKQSIDSPAWQGYIKVIDAIGFLEKFPLRAEEKMELKLIASDLNTEINLYTNIIKVTDIQPLQSNNGSSYTIHFVSEETFKGGTRSVSKAYDLQTSDTVREVFNTYYSNIPTKENASTQDSVHDRVLPFGARRYLITETQKRKQQRNLFIQDTASRSRLVIPRLTPAETMQMLGARSYNPETPSCTFRFFETLENYYFCTDEFLVKDIENDHVIQLYYSPTASVDPKAPLDQINRIESLHIAQKSIDLEKDVFSGSYRSEVTELDFVRKKANIRNFNYDTDGKYMDMKGDIRSLDDNPHTEEFRNDIFTKENARSFMIFKDYQSSGDLSSNIHRNRFLSEIIQNRVSYLSHLNNTQVEVSLKGRLDIRPGYIVNLNIPELSTGTLNNETLSGRYLIKSTSHVISEGVLETSLQLSKFDWNRGDVWFWCRS